MSRQRQDINLAIDVTHALMRPGEQLSTKAIAEICGCHQNAIDSIYLTALKKTRERLRRMLALNHAEMAHTKVNEHL